MKKIKDMVWYYLVYWKLLFIYRENKTAVEAMRIHHKCGQKYDSVLPYAVHLDLVNYYYSKFSNLIIATIGWVFPRQLDPVSPV